MSYMKNIWFISDTHILHENIVHNLGSGRPFTNMDHMVSSIRNNWIQNVKPDDDIYHLGDAAMGDFTESIKFFEDLPGNKFFVPGNHDKIFSGNTKNHIERFLPFYEKAGFTVLPEIVEISFDTSYGSQKVLVSHFPYSEPYLKGRYDKYEKHRPKNKGLPLIHGHTHSKEQFSGNVLEFHVGVDANNFSPVNAKNIVSWLNMLNTKKLLKN